jgi:topoisomerase IA-like protein
MKSKKDKCLPWIDELEAVYDCINSDDMILVAVEYVKRGDRYSVIRLDAKSFLARSVTLDDAFNTALEALTNGRSAKKPKKKKTARKAKSCKASPKKPATVKNGVNRDAKETLTPS